ncbi:MAG: glycoside hydrolase family 88 protein [Bacteroidaceae bacterium]|nr:glycoside hydrolase family 88 protein [Bacteroidaceae bacterium]
MFKKLFTTNAITSAIFLFFVCATSLSAQNKYERLAKDFVKSEMMRYPQAWMLEGHKTPKWSYTMGLEILSMRGWMSDDEWTTYAKSFADTLINSSGQIRGYKRKDFKLDDINSGKMLFTLYDLTKDNRYKIALDTLYAQIALQPHTPEGGMWHKTIYPNQMWLDGQYMSLPFVLEYAKRFGTKQDFDDALHFVHEQINLVCSHTLCNECHLYHHAWDSSHKMGWADKNNGKSMHAWGRAEGWLMMALVDCLDIYYEGQVPVFDEGKEGGYTPDPMVTIITDLATNLIPLQDSKTKTWQQVLDCTGKEGNYQETTCSAMFAYAMLKGSRIGAFQSAYHDSKYYEKVGKKTLDGIMKHFISKDSDGYVYLHNCCSVAGLSDKRDGSYEYYLSEKIVDNDPKGLGPLLMALKEVCR